MSRAPWGRCWWCRKPLAWFQMGSCRDCASFKTSTTGHPPYGPDSRRTMPPDRMFGYRR